MVADHQVDRFGQLDAVRVTVDEDAAIAITGTCECLTRHVDHGARVDGKYPTRARLKTEKAEDAGAAAQVRDGPAGTHDLGDRGPELS